jgi:hypothetical protein
VANWGAVDTFDEGNTRCLAPRRYRGTPDFSERPTNSARPAGSQREDADPDIPVLNEAKAEFARLQ